MTTNASAEKTKPEALGRVTFLDGQGELPMLEISTAWSTAAIYLHGAHVTQFKKKDEPPLLFLSQCSRFAEERPIRGGIPVIFPWFGPREGLAQHGFARVKAWEIKEFAPAPDGSVSVRFYLPDCPEASAFPAFTADYIVTVNRALTLQLLVTEIGHLPCLGNPRVPDHGGSRPLLFHEDPATEARVEDFNRAGRIQINAVYLGGDAQRVTGFGFLHKACDGDRKSVV